MSKVRASAVALAAGLSLCAAEAAVAANATSEVKSTQGFRKAVTVQGIQEHLRAFQAHADAHGGNRAAGNPGFESSRAYVMSQAAKAGLKVSEHSFEFVYNADKTPPKLVKTAPAPAVTYVDGTDFATMTFSLNANAVNAPVYAVDLVLPKAATPGGTTSGCETSDFAGFPAGAIALMQRGTCPFGTKAANAFAAGAAGAIIFNDGGDAGREGIINGTLGGPGTGPAVGTTLAIGQAFANGVKNGATGTRADLKIDRVNETRTTKNVIAETTTGDPNSVIVVGAHLDSVPRGAGINDNGTGSAGILEIAEELGRREFGPMKNRIRFMWYSAEEFGLLGSNAYVADLKKAGQLKKVKAMLNFDMIGSPNYVRFVYDGDNSGFPVGPGAAAGPQGSGEIERIFRDYFVGVGLTSGETPFSGRSDYGGFIAEGIPAGGLFTGAEGVKTPGQARIYGGTANVAYDKCYHLFCDTIANVNTKGLDEMADAAAHATWTIGKRDLAKQPLINPKTKVGGSDGLTPEGGGLHDDHDHDAEAR